MIFITGGVRSGKSAFAERTAANIAQAENFIYIATGIPFDQEMQERIARHQQDRDASGIKWQTIEMEVDFPQLGPTISANTVILFECVTTWLTNLLYKTEGKVERNQFVRQKIDELKQLLLRWQRKGITVILVSNEVLDEPSSIYEEVNYYRQLLGQLHQWIVYNSTEAYEVQFNIEQKWK